MGGGFTVGARMGDDLATGSGKWGGVAGDTSIGGVTTEVGFAEGVGCVDSSLEAGSDGRTSVSAGLADEAVEIGRDGIKGG
jgi:hypothetical protein